MRKFILGVLGAIALGAIAPAQAADMPVKAVPMVPVVAPYNWSGIYVGANGGYSWGRSDTDVEFLTYPGGVPIVPPAGSITSAEFDLNGAIAGLQAGFNWQRDRWVFGIEGDIQWSGQKGSADFVCSAPVVVAAAAIPGPCWPSLTFVPAGAAGTTLSLEQKLRWFGTLRGRVGMTITPTWLVYATGGLAVGDIETSATLSGFNGNGLPVSIATSNSSTRVGWTVGAGLEGVISGRWTGKIEYLYVDYGDVSGNIALLNAGIQANYSSHITDNVLRVGLNYRFSP
jgi:outer membrane immunogenic protein